MKRVLRILHGWIYWNLFRIVNHISYGTVVLVLNNDNVKLDRYAVNYLPLFVQRKVAKNAVIIWNDNGMREWLKKCNCEFRCKTKYMSIKHIELLYDFYSFDKFFDNIVFTYTSRPKENFLGKILKETDVNEKDAVCLALYHLRYVPE